MSASGLQCIFCGGLRPATTEEHCPPRALFRDKAWPEGYAFPACKDCNGGSSDDDLIVAFLAQLRIGADQATQQKAGGLMKAVNRQHPGFLRQMVDLSAVEARAVARRLGMSPEPGQTYQQMGVVRIPEAMHSGVESVAAKFTKGVYFRHTGAVFPADGGILFHWFTNAQLREHGSIPVLDVFAQFAAVEPPLTRNGRNLSDQFSYRYSAAEDGSVHVLQATVSDVFGFVTLFSPIPGQMAGMRDEMRARLGGTFSPFKLL